MDMGVAGQAEFFSAEVTEAGLNMSCARAAGVTHAGLTCW